MADATRKHQHNACVSAMRSAEPMPPAARLWLARASLFTDDKGRTSYGPARCGGDVGLDPDHIEAGIHWLLAAGLVLHDHDDNGVECWRLAHYDWAKGDTIGGYSADAGQVRDGLPPQYGRRVDDVITPPSGNLDYTPPTWADIAPSIRGGQQ
jgi:hypothetical protein